MTIERTEDEVVSDVLFGLMSIDDGVAWGLKHGLPYQTLPASEITALQDAAWTIEQALGWIAWRTNEGAARAAALLRYWGKHYFSARSEAGQRGSVAASRNELWNGLVDGSVRVTGIAGPRTIRSSSAPRLPIPPTDLIDLQWASDGLSRHALQVEKQWIDVRVLSSDVRRLWPAEAAATAAPTTAISHTRSTSISGGRVMADHWHDMWAEVCRIVHDEGVPEDRLTLVKRMQQWFADHGLEAPAPQKLNPVLDRLFKALGR